MTKSVAKRSLWPAVANFAGVVVQSFFWLIMAQLIAKTYSPEFGRGIISILLVGVTVPISTGIQGVARKAAAYLERRSEGGSIAVN
ncbi:hypothetical protein LMG31884_46890 (plasmid) [Xanthomonas hydrangeae]|uniref:hypothetical protein n=1 Tax=Xanthomonas hydrangeae TaxID=2775159 RepID=UPI001AFABF84|nr:hypothetical protein LMG31884_46890 [Xanthomonas hydrangeae]CAD7740621.1 hypothetical protein LMG31884_46890 [Xanthomonas hydrangeae]